MTAASGVSGGLLIPTLPLFLLSRGLSFLEMAGVFSAIAVATAGVQVFAGRRPDWFARQGLALWLLVISLAALPLYLLASTAAHFALVAGVSSLASGAAGPGIQLILLRQSPPEARGLHQATFNAVSSIGYAGGLILGGALLAFGFKAVLIAAAFAGVLPLALLCHEAIAFRRVKAREPADLTRARRALREAAAGLRRARAAAGAPPSGRVRRSLNGHLLALHFFLFGIGVAAYPVYLPRLLQVRGLPLPWIGLAIAGSWILFALVQPAVARRADSTAHPRSLALASLAGVALLNLVISGAPLAWVIAAWSLLGVVDAAARPFVYSLFAKGVAPEESATAFGLLGAAVTLSRIVGPVAVALVIQARGLDVGFLFVGLALAASAFPLAWVRVRAAGDTASPRPRGVAA